MFKHNSALLLLVLALWAMTSPVFAQQNIHYRVSFENAAHHEATIQATFSGITGPEFEVHMARSSPGRYALHEFAKNVYSVVITDGQGKSLSVTRPDLHSWRVAGHNGTVKVSYTLFADHPDGTYAGVDQTHAHLNAPATFMYAPSMEKAPINVQFIPPANRTWTAATQLKPEAGTLTFSAPDFQYLMDSPTELADLAWREWAVKDQKIRIAMHHRGTEKELDEYTQKTKNIVLEMEAVFGELPRFDFGTYTFIACYLPTTPGDGMEHRNSTIVTSSRDLTTGMVATLGTVSHEFFHAWNVERIRPQSLEPFDFTDANMSEALWLAEGFTSYYGDLMMHRAGATTEPQLLHELTKELTYVLQAPGRAYFSAVEMSMQAPFVDASRSVDPVNRQNTYISYYTYGSAIGIGLDWTLRSRFNSSLDDFMRLLWERFGKAEKPYTLPEIEKALADLTKDPAFAKDFFQRHIYGKELMSYETLANQMGLVLRPVSPGKAEISWEGLKFEKGQVTITSGTYQNSPLYKAGLDRGDVILTIDGKKIKDQKTLEKILSRKKPGDQVTLEIEQIGVKSTKTVTLAQDPALELVPMEKAGRAISNEVKARRQAWLASKRK